MITIAIADDHILFRKGIVELINDFSGFKVVLQANNGLELLDKLKTTPPPDIVVLDIQMPILNGYETAEKISKEFPNAKILALSMYGDELSVIRMLKCGAKGYVLKDAEPEELENALNDIVQRGFYYSNEVGHLLLNNMQGANRTELKDRELQFLELVSTEKTYKEIADVMCVSPRTVDGYREDLFEKLDVKSRVGLVVYAIKQGIYKLE